MNYFYERFKKLSSVRIIMITTVSLETRNPFNISQSAGGLNIVVVVVIVVEQSGVQ